MSLEVCNAQGNFFLQPNAKKKYALVTHVRFLKVYPFFHFDRQILLRDKY